MNFQKAFHFLFLLTHPARFLTSICALGMFIMIVSFYGCGGASVSKTVENTSYVDLSELNEMFGFSTPSTDRLSPLDSSFSLESLISTFGDVPQVRTYYAFLEKMHTPEPLTIDSVIAFAAADLYLFPSETKAKELEKLKTLAIQIESVGLSDFVQTYKIRIDHELGDGIEIYYPDGSRKESASPKQRKSPYYGLTETIISVQEAYTTRQSSATPEAKKSHGSTD